jgi:hypothetical protein
MNRVPEYVWTKEEAQIIKAAWADEHGRRALNLIIDRLCNVMGSSMVLGDPHATSFQEGRRWPAQQLAIVIKMPLDQLTQDTPHEPAGSSPVLTATERAARGSLPRPKR